MSPKRLRDLPVTIVDVDGLHAVHVDVRMVRNQKNALQTSYTPENFTIRSVKYLNGSDFDVKNRLAPQKSAENDEKLISETNFFSKKKIGVKKSKVAHRVKRTLPKFRADRSHVRG